MASILVEANERYTGYLSWNDDDDDESRIANKSHPLCRVKVLIGNRFHYINILNTWDNGIEQLPTADEGNPFPNREYSKNVLRSLAERPFERRGFVFRLFFQENLYGFDLKKYHWRGTSAELLAELELGIRDQMNPRPKKPWYLEYYEEVFQEKKKRKTSDCDEVIEIIDLTDD